MRDLGWLAYVPAPGLFLVPLLARREDRLARFHAVQGGTLVMVACAGLVVLGLARPFAPDVLAAASAAWVLASLAGLAWGGWGAARGLFLRVRPVWDLLSAFSG